MSQSSGRWIATAAVLLVGGGGLAWLSLRAPSAPEDDATPTAASASPEWESPEILENAQPHPAEAEAQTETEEPAAGGERSEDGPSPAPGAAPWANGLDLPPPAVPDTPPPVDPAHMRYREAAENVEPADQVAYLERSLDLLDTSIGALEANLAEAEGTSRAQRVAVRLARMRGAREERAAELAAMRARATGAPEEEPTSEGPSAP